MLAKSFFHFSRMISGLATTGRPLNVNRSASSNARSLNPPDNSPTYVGKCPRCSTTPGANTRAPWALNPARTSICPYDAGDDLFVP